MNSQNISRMKNEEIEMLKGKVKEQQEEIEKLKKKTRKHKWLILSMLFDR